MRQIKFRGRCAITGAWRYGFYYISKGNHIIRDDQDRESIVLSATVCESTGLKDKNGKEIFENDIIAISSRGFDFDCQITHDKQLIPVGEKSKGWEHMLYSPDWDRCEIIGTIHDGKEER